MQAANQFIYRLILSLSDLCDSDEEIALCLNHLHITNPSGTDWSGAKVRELFPIACSTVTSFSEYAPNFRNLDFYKQIVAIVQRERLDHQT